MGVVFSDGSNSAIDLPDSFDKCFSTQGLRFLHFPYLLTLQLKRFDFDYTTMHRIKLNDRMTFPEELDMSPFIDVEDEVRAAVAVPASITICDLN